jgi:hypothetical protein
MFKEGRIVEAGSLSDEAAISKRNETVPVSDRRFKVEDVQYSEMTNWFTSSSVWKSVM